MKTLMTIVLYFCLAVSVTACSRSSDVNESITSQSQSINEIAHESGSDIAETAMIENHAVLSSGLNEALTEDTVFGVKIYVDRPHDTDLSAKDLETFKHEDSITYLYVVPRYAGSSITLESMDFDESRNEFVTTGILYEAVSTDDYALLVQADLPEAGLRLRITVAHENMTAVYEPSYDGRGDTIYPLVKNGVLLDEAQSSIPTALPGTSVLADFQRPEFLHYTISNIAYDEATETYAILYAVSNYNGDKPWLTYYNDNSDYRDNSQLHIQLFDKQGAFLRKIETGLEPITDSEIAVIPSDPSTYRDGMLTFFSGFPQYYVFYDTESEAYTSVPAQRCVTDGEYFMIDDGALTGVEFTAKYVYSLYHKNQLVAAINLDTDDLSFQLPDNRYYEGKRNDVFTLDRRNKTAIIGNDKLTYYLDFNTRTWRMERHYTREHLEDLVATSPDGQWEIYLADTGGAGDGFWADLVSLDTNSGAVTYLTNGHSRSAAFGADNLLLFNKTGSLELIDVEKGKVINKKFGIDCTAKDCYINGIAYDPQKDWFLVAWRSPQQGVINNRDEKLPLMLDIYDRHGTLVKSMDTGYEIIPFHINWVVNLSLEVDGNGFVTILDTNKVMGDELIGKVKYD